MWDAAALRSTPQLLHSVPFDEDGRFGCIAGDNWSKRKLPQVGKSVIAWPASCTKNEPRPPAANWRFEAVPRASRFFH